MYVYLMDVTACDVTNNNTMWKTFPLNSKAQLTDDEHEKMYYIDRFIDRAYGLYQWKRVVND